MKKIILEILLSLNIYAIIYSKCSDYDNKQEDCLKESQTGKYPDLCCFYKEEGNIDGSGLCKAIPYSSYSQEYKREYIDGILYNINCSKINKETFNLERCGNIYDQNPSKKECKKYSTYVDSCCFYSGKNNADDPKNEGKPFVKGCYWLGSKYEGSIYWAGARLDCSFKFLSYSLFALLYLIILL